MELKKAAFNYMGNKVTRYLILSQIFLFSFLILCVVIDPRFVLEHNEGGASNYGVHWATGFPYSLALLLSSALIFKAARLVSRDTQTLRRFRGILFVTVFLLMFVLLSTYPYKLNPAFNNLHTVSAVMLCSIGVAMAVWMALGLVKSRLNINLIVIVLVGFAVSAFTFFGATHLLFVGETVTGLAFGAILVNTGHELTKD